MHFKHPEILYFLFLLLIPILVHLFQLRRFKKEYFTNVHFLKELSIQTRKSSKLKKYLLLTTRLLLLAALIFAFAQPFFEAKDSKMASNEMYFVLDNSFSMQAKGKKGELMKRAVQELLEQIPENQQFSLISNSEQFWETDIKSIQKELQQLDYSANSFGLESILGQIKSKNPRQKKDLIVITDAVGIELQQLKAIDSSFNTYFVTPKAEQKENVSVDSVFINQTLDRFYEIGVNLSVSGNFEGSVPVALYNSNKLVAKTLVEDLSKKTILFTIPKQDFAGHVSINDNALTYDNDYFFNISSTEKTNVLSIGPISKNNYLRKIYSENEFNYQHFELKQLNYNLIEQQDAVVVNEAEDIPQALQTTLKAFVEKGGNLILIPSPEMQPQTLNSFLSQFGKIQAKTTAEQEKQVSKISYSNPLFSTVFEKKTDNFQYPTVKTKLEISSNFPAVLSFADQQPFLISIPNPVSSVYVFSSAINKEVSNFQNSPLIVPTFYNMAKSSQKSGIVALKIGSNNPFIANATLAKDEILSLKNSSKPDESGFIPMQQLLNNKVKLSFQDAPQKSGNYGLYKKEQNVQQLGFNYERTESELSADYAVLDGFEIVSGIDTVFDQIKSDRTDNNLWKWFVALAILFLIAEIFIQKLLK